MIQIKDKVNCCGCHACSSICPSRCITMQSDEQGFLYPSIDEDVCVNCGLCEKVCPVININNGRKPIKTYASKNLDDEIRKSSSSGGVFSLLAEKVIKEGGVVFGAKFNDNWEVVHSWTDSIEGLESFRGSKYSQSVMGETYKFVQTFLMQERKVLFSGTPCQISGLKHFLRKEYVNLITIDIACHGVPSPLIWKRYLQDINPNHEKIEYISMRDKTEGWKNYYIRVQGTTSTLCFDTVRTNIFMRGYLSNIFLRPSCYQCSFRSGKSGSDITIADFWGIRHCRADFDDDMGVSLVMINSENGLKIYNELVVSHHEVTYEQGIIENSCLENSVIKPIYYYNKFWQSSIGIESIDRISKIMRLPFLKRMIMRLIKLV